MVPTIQEPETTEVVAPNSPIPVSPPALETLESPTAEWPQLGTFEGIEQDEVERTEWRNYELPGELDLVNDDTPQELRTIVHESKRQVLRDPDDINYGIPEHGSTENPEAPASTRRPLSIASSAGVSETSQNSSQNETRQRSPSASSSTLNIPGKLTNGQPTVRMGPLGWIITYPEGERPKKSKKSKEPKEAKEDSVLKKFLKEKRAERTTGECASCMEDMSNKKLHALACTHKYCSPCFEQLVTTAMQNENQFPPKCCLQEIPIKFILSNISPEQKDQFKLKAQEYAVPANNRWYCPSTTCAKWIPLDKLKKRSNEQACPHCRIAICGICRGTAHANNEDCPQDFGLDATLEEAEREGWRRCYRCRAMVELTVGCRHITCKCKAEFCYTCGAVWRTCACTELDQARRHQEILDRRAERNRVSAEDVAAAAAEAAEVAAAIAAVERQEREEEEKRQRLEQQRIEEEERRRELEAAAARLKEQARVRLITARSREFERLLRDIHKIQRDALIKRHMEETSRLHADIESSSLQFTARQNLLRVTLHQNLKSRLQILAEEQVEKQTAITTRHEEEEDDLFVRMTTHLRNKPNRESREKSMVEKLKKAQEEELAALEEEQRLKREELEWMGNLESRNLEDNLRLKREEEVCREGDRVAALVRSVWAQRKWFETVVARREQMIPEFRERAIASGLDLAPKRTETEAQADLEADATTARAATILVAKRTGTSSSAEERSESGSGTISPNSSSTSTSTSPSPTAQPHWNANIPGLRKLADGTYERDPLMRKRVTETRAPRVERERYPAGMGMFPAREVNGRVARVY